MTERRKRKQRRHKKSVLQKQDGTCYLCRCLHGDARIHLHLEEHHVFYGIANRWKSEEDGMKVYLCANHHRSGREAVHLNGESNLLVKRAAQRKFEETRTREDFVKRYGKSYL